MKKSAKLRTFVLVFVACLALAVFTACTNGKPEYSLNKTSATLAVGETVQLSVTSSDETQFEVSWESADTDVVTVNPQGLVTAVSVGNAAVTASVDGTDLVCNVTVVAYEYSISKTATTINKGEGEQLTVTVTPEKPLSVEWFSGDMSVATVSDGGYVTAVGAGQANITAYVDGQSLICAVTVPLVYEYSLSDERIEIFETYTAQLSVSVTPAAEMGSVAWSSSDDSIATVSDHGVVTGVSVGTATITAVADGNNLTCTVTVKELVYEYTVTQSLSVARGQTADISVVVTPEKQLDVSYQSSNTEIAAVDEDGTVTGVAMGSTTVTVTTDGKLFTVNVEVTAGVTATSENSEFTSAATVNLTEEHVTYWEHYGSSGDDKMLNAEDVITNNTIENASSSFYDYKASINWTNGTSVRTWIGDGNNSGRHTGTDCSVISFDVAVKAGNTVIRIYTGAWKATNVTELCDGDTVIASAAEFTAGDASVNMLVTFTVVSDAAKTLTVKITPAYSSSGNCSLVAVAVLGDASSVNATTSVSVNKTEMTGADYDVIDLTSRGDLDWYYLNYEGVSDRKNGGTALIDTSSFVYSAEANFWDYKAAFGWTDGTDYATSLTDDDCTNGTNNGKCGDYVSFNVNVNANVKTITLWVGGYQAEYYLEVIDSKGTLILKERMGLAPSGVSLAYEANIAVDATADEVLTIVVYRTTGSNCSLAAVAVSANNWAEETYALSASSQSLAVGQTVDLSVTPAYGYVKWTSSDTSVATVSNGTVTGVAGGTATVTATVRGQTMSCSVTVYEYTLNRTSVQINSDQTAQLTVTSNPSAELPEIVWTSENEEVATVVNGLITAVGGGQTVIKANVAGIVLECTVSVSEYTYSLTQELSLDLNGTAVSQLTVDVTPEKEDMAIAWSSSDDSVATVENGQVTAVGIGRATITAVVDKVTLQCEVTVTHSGISVTNQTVNGQAQYNITSEISGLIDWEYYGDGSDSDSMLNSNGYITNDIDSYATATFSDYKLYMNWTNGSKNLAYIGNYNSNGRTLPNGITFTVTLPAGTSKIYAFTGAWQATNLTELYLDGALIAKADAFEAGSSSVNTIVVFTVVSDSQKTYTVKINCNDSYGGGNCSLVAVAVTGSSTTTTSVTLSSQVEMTGYNDCHINLTERGAIDWWYLNYEGSYYDEKSGGTAIDVSSFFGEQNRFWDYKAAFSWTDGTNYETSPIDNDCNEQGTNNGYCGGFEAVNITVDAETSCISMWVGGYDSASYYVEVVDSNGNVLINQYIAVSDSGSTAAYEVNLAISATVQETVTVAVYKTTGNNCSLAAVAVS